MTAPRDCQDRPIRKGDIVRVEGIVEQVPGTGSEVRIRVSEEISVWVLARAVQVVEAKP